MTLDHDPEFGPWEARWLFAGQLLRHVRDLDLGLLAWAVAAAVQGRLRVRARLEDHRAPFVQLVVQRVCGDAASLVVVHGASTEEAARWATETLCVVLPAEWAAWAVRVGGPLTEHLGRSVARLRAQRTIRRPGRPELRVVPRVDDRSVN